MKTFKRFILIILMLFSANIAFAVSYPEPQGKLVNDFIGVLDIATEKRIEQTLRDFEKKTTNEIAVVLVSDLQGENIDMYAVKLFGHCNKCNTDFSAIYYSDWNPKAFNRTFTTWDDFGVVFKKLVDSGQIEQFLDWTSDEFLRDNQHKLKNVIDSFYKYIPWLLNPERFNALVYQAGQEGMIKI